MSIWRWIALPGIGLIVFFLLQTQEGRQLLLPEQEEERDSRRIEKLKKRTAKILSRGRSRVAIQLFNGNCLRGYIRKCRNDFLELISDETGTNAQVDWMAIRKINLFHSSSAF